MSVGVDEVRYGRLCLLILHACPLRLRGIIDNSYCRGVPDFETFLNNNVHQLFHLRYRNCCCGNTRNDTHISKTQWDLLYSQISTRNPHGRRGECPCQYKAKNGVTSDVLDITFCCLFLTNICPYIPQTDVDTIRQVRNELIHANTTSMDVQSFNDKWKEVEQALLNLSNAVSLIFANETQTILDDLKNRVIDPCELDSLVTIMKADHRRLDSVEEYTRTLMTRVEEQEEATGRVTDTIGRVQREHTDTTSKLTRRIDTLDDIQTERDENTRTLISRMDNQEEATGRVTETIGRVQKEHTDTTSKLTRRIDRLETVQNAQNENTRALETRMDNQEEATDKISEAIGRVQRDMTSRVAAVEENVASLQRAQTTEEAGTSSGDIAEALREVQRELIQVYTDITKSVDVLPFQDHSPGLPIDNIFAPLLMEEDLKSKERMPNPDNPGGKQLKSLQEMFYTTDKPARRIFMKGEAGCGKTFFCLKLLDTWCQVKQSGKVTNDVLQQCLDAFDLVFYLPLRHFKGNVASVKDMIGQTVSEQCLNLVSGGRLHCMVILDGLDESPVTFKELPSMHGIVNYVLFCTTRPWKLTQLSLTYSHDDKVVQILGLLPTSEKKVIECVLVNFYKRKKETKEFKKKFKRYSSMLKISSLESLVKIPMMLTACCCMWYEEDANYEQAEDRKGQVIKYSPTIHTSMTHTYLSLLDSMIRRAEQKCDLRSILTQAPPFPHSNIPKVLASFLYIHSFLGTLLPLCRLAYNDLVSGETKLVFQKDELEREIGPALVEIALKVGLISQAKAPGRFHQQNISVNFYHKSVQEFLAAVHLTCTDTDDIRSYCTSLDKVMNVANIIMFGIVLDPSFCHDVSKHVIDTANTDSGIQQYRRTLDNKGRIRVERLYRTQLQWYRELTHSRTVTGDTSPPPSLYVTDIHLAPRSDSDTVRLTGELMCSNRDTIVSMTLNYVHHPLHGKLQWLPQCPNLAALLIDMPNTENRAKSFVVIPLLTQLHTIRCHGVHRGASVENVLFVTAVLRLKQLRNIWLEDVSLGDDGVVLTTDWTRLHTVVLGPFVEMTARSWGRFVSSLLTVRHPVHVTLRYTDIDAATVRRIQTSPHFTGAGDYGKFREFTFMTVPHTVTRYDEERIVGRESGRSAS